MSKKIIRIESCDKCPYSYNSNYWKSLSCSIAYDGITPICPDDTIRDDCPLEDEKPKGDHE